LDGGDTEAEQPQQATAGQLLEVGLRRLTDPADRGVDAAAARGDLLIAQSIEPQLKLVFARAGEDQMRMTIDQPRQHHLAGGGEDLGIRRHCWQRSGGTDPGDAAVLDQDGCLWENGNLTQRAAALEALARSGNADELGDISDNECGSHDRVLPANGYVG